MTEIRKKLVCCLRYKKQVRKMNMPQESFQKYLQSAILLEVLDFRKSFKKQIFLFYLLQQANYTLDKARMKMNSQFNILSEKTNFDRSFKFIIFFLKSPSLFQQRI